MGSGKSTIGKKLSERMGYEFIDLDKLMEGLEKKTVAEIFFLKEEEEFFRQLEADVCIPPSCIKCRYFLQRRHVFISIIWNGWMPAV